MFGSPRPDAEQLAAAERVAAWTRERFRLPPQAAVLVTEVVCGLPGCPPLETVIAFWTGPEAQVQRHHYKVFKPIRLVLQDDLPPWWMRDALAAAPGDLGDCC